MILKLAIKHIPMYQSKIAKISNTFWASPQKQNFKNLCMSSAKWYLQPSHTTASPESCWLAGDICITFAVVWQQGLTHIWTHSDISTNLHFPHKPRSPWLGHPCPVLNKPIFPTLFWHGWSSSSLLINTRGKKRKCDKTHQWPLSLCVLMWLHLWGLTQGTALLSYMYFPVEAFLFSFLGFIQTPNFKFIKTVMDHLQDRKILWVQSA